MTFPSFPTYRRLAALTLGVAGLALAGSFAHADDAPHAGRKPPLTITLDTTDAPECADFAKHAKAVGEKEYAMIAKALPSPGFTPVDHVKITFKQMDGVAYTAGIDVTCAAAYFKDHPDDVGAIVHELTHVVQHYTTGEQPGWLVEGIADYVRWYLYEPANKRPHPNAQTSHYNDSYQTTAAFLDWAQRKYDHRLVEKLNLAMRKGYYHPSAWKTITGKTVEQLGDQWEASLKAGK